MEKGKGWFLYIFLCIFECLNLMRIYLFRNIVEIKSIYIDFNILEKEIILII